MLKGWKRKAGVALVIVLAAVMGWAALPLLRPLSARPPDRFNVIWISIDALRPDHLGCYGYERPVSPAIDRLAGRGARFERAYAQSSWTLPSSFSFLTARYPSAHGLTLTSLPPKKTFESIYHLNAFTLFHNSGYAIRGLLNSWYGAGVMGRLFPEVEEASGGAFGMGLKAKWFMLRNRHRPFFIILHYMEAHGPYQPREGFIEAFRDPANSAVYDDDFVKEVNTGAHNLTAVERARIVDNYDSGIAYLDDQARRLLGFVDSLGLTGRTIVVITADHGEAFMEHGRLAHSLTLHNEVMQVPLIIAVPGLTDHGLVVPDRVQSIDLSPTLLELAGIERPGLMQGKSLVPLLRGERPDELAHRDVFAEMTMDSWYYYPDHLKVSHGKTPGPEGQYVAAVISGKWKLIHYLRTGRSELFDLESDPAETLDLAAAETAMAEAMKKKLDDYFQQNLDAGGVDVRAEAKMTDAEIWKRSYDLFPSLSKEVIDQLKGLGYLN